MTGQFKLQSRSNLNHAFSVTDDQLSRTNCLDNNNNNCNKNLQPCVALRFDRDTKKIRQPKYKQHIHKCACVRERVRVYVCESVCVNVCVCVCVWVCVCQSKFVETNEECSLNLPSCRWDIVIQIGPPHMDSRTKWTDGGRMDYKTSPTSTWTESLRIQTQRCFNMVAGVV